MTGINIISTKKDTIYLNFEEIRDIFNWINTKDLITISGENVFKHPDILKITKLAAENFKTAVLYANPADDENITENIANASPKIIWVVKVQDGVKLDKLFSKMLKNVVLEIEFKNEPEVDRRNIEKAILIKKSCPDTVLNYRISFRMPKYGEVLNMQSFDEILNEFMEISQKETPGTKLCFDCPVNNCQISLQTMAKLLEDNRTPNLSTTYSCIPMIEIMPDKSVKYCKYTPDGFKTVKNYREFQNSNECFEYFLKISREYQQDNYIDCRSEKKCTNMVCGGLCFALNALTKI